MVLLAVGLTAYDPVVFLGVAGIVGAGGLLIRMVTKRRLRHNSAAIQRLAPTSSSIVQNAVRGFLELITFRAVRSVQRTYLGRHPELYAVHSRQMVLGIVPTRLYEFLAVTACAASSSLSLWRRIRCGVFRNPFFARTECLPRDAGHGPQPIPASSPCAAKCTCSTPWKTRAAATATMSTHCTCRSRIESEKPCRNRSAQFHACLRRAAIPSWHGLPHLNRAKSTPSRALRDLEKAR